MTGEQKLSLLEEIRARRIPVIKQHKTTKSRAIGAITKEVKSTRKLRKAKSAEDILKYMNERIANMESKSHD